MRRGYGLDNRDIEKLTPIMEGIIYRLEPHLYDLAMEE